MFGFDGGIDWDVLEEAHSGKIKAFARGWRKIGKGYGDGREQLGKAEIYTFKEHTRDMWSR